MKIQPQPRRLGAFLSFCFLIALALYGLFHLPGGEGDVVAGLGGIKCGLQVVAGLEGDFAGRQWREDHLR